MGHTRSKPSRYAGYVLAAVLVCGALAFAQQKSQNATYDTEHNPPHWGLENHTSFKFLPGADGSKIAVAGNPLTGFWIEQGLRFSARAFEGTIRDGILAAATLTGGVDATFEPTQGETITIGTPKLVYAEGSTSSIRLPQPFSLLYESTDGQGRGSLRIEAPSGTLTLDALSNAANDPLRELAIQGQVKFVVATSEPATVTANGKEAPATRTSTVDGTAQGAKYSRATRELILSGPVEFTTTQRVVSSVASVAPSGFSSHSQTSVALIIELDKDFQVVSVRSGEGSTTIREDPPSE